MASADWQLPGAVSRQNCLTTYLQGQWQVPVVQGHDRHDAVGNQLVDEAVVEGNTALVDL